VISLVGASVLLLATVMLGYRFRLLALCQPAEIRTARHRDADEPAAYSISRGRCGDRELETHIAQITPASALGLRLPHALRSLVGFTAYVWLLQ